LIFGNLSEFDEALGDFDFDFPEVPDFLEDVE
jgi:hypothetical protein